MTKKEMVKLIRSSVQEWNEWRDQNPGAEINLEFANLSDLNLEGIDLSQANLNNCYFVNTKFANANFQYSTFVNSNLRKADLSLTNLEKCDLSNTDLSNADLRAINIKNADFSLACMRETIIPMVPVISNIHIKMWDTITDPRNSINMNEWHTCDSVHCWAGWICILAGEEGCNLEQEYGTNTAASLILMASDPKLEKIPNWYSGEDEACEAIKALSTKQRQNNDN